MFCVRAVLFACVDVLVDCVFFLVLLVCCVLLVVCAALCAQKSQKLPLFAATASAVSLQKTHSVSFFSRNLYSISFSKHS